MAENKTRRTEASVQGYLAAIDDDTRRKDCEALSKLMTKATRHPPKMWGSSIVGFSSRKGDISVYGLNAAVDAKKLLAGLGKHKAGKGCVYIKTLADVELKVLATLVASAAAEKQRQHA